MQRQDVLALDLRDGKLAQNGHDVPGEHQPVVRGGRRLAMQLHMLAHIAVRQVGERRLGRDGLFSRLDAGDDRRRLLARLVG